MIKQYSTSTVHDLNFKGKIFMLRNMIEVLFYYGLKHAINMINNKFILFIKKSTLIQNICLYPSCSHKVCLF